MFATMVASAKHYRAQSQPRRGLRREEAATYIGIAPTTFDKWVERGIMPKPKRQDGIVLWDVLSLDCSFSSLPDDADENPWDGGVAK